MLFGTWVYFVRKKALATYDCYDVDDLGYSIQSKYFPRLSFSSSHISVMQAGFLAA